MLEALMKGGELPLGPIMRNDDAPLTDEVLASRAKNLVASLKNKPIDSPEWTF
jgi:hypothetical protein